MRFWIDCEWVHLSIGGRRVKSLRSRFTVYDLDTLVAQGAVPAGPPPLPSKPAPGSRANRTVVEVERTVAHGGTVSLGQRVLLAPRSSPADGSAHARTAARKSPTRATPALKSGRAHVTAGDRAGNQTGRHPTPVHARSTQGRSPRPESQAGRSPLTPGSGGALAQNANPEVVGCRGP